MNVTKKSSRLAADFCEQEINLCYLFDNITCPILTIKTDGVDILFPPTFNLRDDSHMNNPGSRASWGVDTPLLWKQRRTDSEGGSRPHFLASHSSISLVLNILLPLLSLCTSHTSAKLSAYFSRF